MSQIDLNPVQLLGPQLCVAKPCCSREQLAQLTAETADTLFGMLQEHILAAHQYLHVPNGIRGLVLLVKAQPQLQERLLELLEALPVDRCGPWLARGWEAALPDEKYIRRYISLLKQWSHARNNDMLSHAARMLLGASGI